MGEVRALPSEAGQEESDPLELLTQNLFQFLLHKKLEFHLVLDKDFLDPQTHRVSHIPCEEKRMVVNHKHTVGPCRSRLKGAVQVIALFHCP